MPAEMGRRTVAPGRIARVVLAVAGLGAAAVLGRAGVALAIAEDEELREIAASEGSGNLQRCAAQVRSRDFLDIFECGDVFFGTQFNALDGVGANVGDGTRFTRSPRADLRRPGQWATHVP